ncbi:enoyl-CoA hydratase [Paracoccus bogoriensis]|uniref:enoyl-CoA hydratase n=1 Tax=Paracoccus bogoriensis TaxID=242065 RepID=UPI001CA491B4|nr:enoyl-CoA hydratase [Paracoccus bogoriensis]MBW7056937.1 enoyl-CoA hydratase [Paracoccus bogoriensis]
MALLLIHDEGPVARLVLNSPDNHNALSLEMIEALDRAFDRIAASGARVVILSATGRAFCAGHDLRQLQALRDGPDPRADLAALFERCAALMQRLPALPQPVIAQVQGVATAAGCQLVASCDLAVASDQARFGVNGISIGLFCSTPAVALARAIPPKAAFEMLATGDFIPASRAAELGLINRVTAPDQLEAETLALARNIAAKPPAAMRLGKAAFHRQRAESLGEAYRTASDAICANMMLEETVEGITAFLEKRAPRWP